MKKLTPFLLFLLLVKAGYSQKLTDTIFYNQYWKICERPIADYYRIGTLAIDSFWFFTGHIEDYTMDHKLVMKGDYSEDGYKNGAFEFYYPDGTLEQKGRYSRDTMRGIWEYYYPNGQLKAVFYFPPDPSRYLVLKFINKEGKTTLENGSGDFEWSDDEPDHPSADADYYGFRVVGTFRDSLRTGTWEYYLGNEKNMNTLTYKEFYDKGRLKKTKYVHYYTEKVESTNIDFQYVPDKIRITERIEYDEFLRKQGTGFLESNDSNFINYMVNGESPLITVKEQEFGKAIFSIVNTLEKYKRKVGADPEQDISGEIEFKIGEKGSPEDVTVSGNISDKAKNFIKYLMSKFQHVQMPMMDSTVGMEGYHKIYFFNFKTSLVAPAAMQEYLPERYFLFSILPRERFLEFAKPLKAKFRRLMRQL